MLHAINELLLKSAANKIVLTIHSDANDHKKLTVITHVDLNAVTHKSTLANENVIAARARLATPLVLEGTPEEIMAAYTPETISAFLESYVPAKQAIDNLSQCQSNHAKVESEVKSKKKAKTKKGSDENSRSQEPINDKIVGKPETADDTLDLFATHSETAVGTSHGFTQEPDEENELPAKPPKVSYIPRQTTVEAQTETPDGHWFDDLECPIVTGAAK